MEYVTQAWQVVFLAGLGIVAFGVLAAWFYLGVRGGQRDEPAAGAILHAILDWRPVNRSAPADPAVMSNSAPADALSSASSLQTDNQTDSRPPAAPPLSREIMLDIYKLLREYNVPRERARPVLKAAGIPLDNNLWLAAAPPPAPHVTPIAQRPTGAVFDADPELRYESPPA